MTAVLRSMLFASSSFFIILQFFLIFVVGTYSIVYDVYVLETRLKSKRIFMGSVHDGGDIRFVVGLKGIRVGDGTKWYRLLLFFHALY